MREFRNRDDERANRYHIGIDTFGPEKHRDYVFAVVNAQDFLKARDNAPKDCDYFGGNHFVGSTHYWNLITLAGKQNEAYQKGMADARKELAINKK
jgi:hypothetical protein